MTLKKAISLKKVVEQARRDFETWPEWMRNAARFEGWGGLEHLRRVDRHKDTCSTGGFT